MPSRLFIFAIGGTGSRVMKSLTMLLASGVRMQHVSEVIPIIVDPHKANEDLRRTESILTKYKQIRDSLQGAPKPGGFFYTPIKTLAEIVPQHDNIGTSYAFELAGVTNENFGDYIDFNGLDNTNKAFASLLFSKENLSTEMDIGFVGNPNIGSVVLNQFKSSAEFQAFASNFSPNDRIFIISSIFGGTGAAGFPIILKNIRGAEAGEIPNPEHLRNARIGALTALPYFGVQATGQNKIDKATFVSKSKAALHYYARGVNKSLNKLYYIGDEVNQDYRYDPGEGGQKNDAHFVELAAALAIVDFGQMPDADLKTENGVPATPVFSEFGIHEDAEELNFRHLSPRTQAELCLPLTKLALLSMYLDHRLHEALETNIPWIRESPAIDRSFVRGNFVETHLKDFNKHFKDWMQEMGRNRRAFRPFNLGKDLANAIVGYEPKKGFWGFAKTDFIGLDEENSSLTRGRSYPGAADKLIDVMAVGTENFLIKKFPDLFAAARKV